MTPRRFPRLLGLGALLGIGAALPAMELTFDASTPAKEPAPLAFAIGGKSPTGHELSGNSRYLTLDGQPWFPVMGEFHYSRYPAAEWETEILKMKAGGINVVASYVFWIHHEETEGKFDWSGQRDLKRFVELCAKHGMKFWLRVGPWAHGEARNGGFPDWLVKQGNTRSNDPAYLAKVKIYFGDIARQVHGQFWKDGGPIIGLQLENEYHPANGGIEHMTELLRLAHEAGLETPYVSATGWDRATIPTTGFLPVFGGYTEQFWSVSRTELPPNQNFFFTNIRAEDNVMGDLSPKNPGYNSKYEGYPFLTAEMGGGMAIAYHRRPILYPDDSTAAAQVKLGAGITGLGFYMYHGGTNPAALTSLHENMLVWNGYNDMETKSYDFQAPLGEFGQVTDTYRAMRTQHLFLHDFGAEMATLPAVFPAQSPKAREDVTTPRAALRTDGQQGFLFINNYQRNVPLGPKTDFQAEVKLAKNTLKVPSTPTTIPDGAYPIWPINLPLNGTVLRYATAQMLCALDKPDTLVCFAWPGLKVEFSFADDGSTKIDALKGKLTRADGTMLVTGIEPGSDVALRVSRAGGPEVQIVVLTREQALGAVKLPLAGRDRIVLSAADVYADGNQLHLASRDPGKFAVSIFPALAKVPSGYIDGKKDGLFHRYVRKLDNFTSSSTVSVTDVKPAGKSVAAKMNPNPRRAVAMEPSDEDFERAAEWRIDVPDTERTGRAFLQISYVGDVARIYAGDRFDNDNFYKGPPWELALWRYSAEELKKGLELKILPLRADTPLFLEKSARPEIPAGGEVLQLKEVKIVREFQTVLDATP